MTSTSQLRPYTFIEFNGVQYIILKNNPANYRLANRAGKTFNLPRHANGITVIPTDQKWLDEVLKPKATATTLEFPKFKMGDPVRLEGKAARKFNGMTGLVAKVNKSTYSVVIENVGVINASHGLVVARDAK